MGYYKINENNFYCAKRLHSWVGGLNRQAKSSLNIRSLAQKEVLWKNYVATECPDDAVQTVRWSG